MAAPQVQQVVLQQQHQVMASSDPLASLLGPPAPPIALSSCSREAAAGASAAAFYWSDFPIIGDSTYLPSSTSMGSYPAPLHDFSVPSSSSSDGEGSLPRAASTDAESSSSCSCPAGLEAGINNTEKEAVSSRNDGKDKKKDKKKSVAFSPIVEVRSHPVVLGDHPCCSNGMALTCGWDCESVEVYDLDVREEHFSLPSSAGGGERRQRTRRRTVEELRLTYAERRNRLCESLGLTGPELLQREFELICGGALNVPGLHHTPSVRRALMEAATSLSC